MMQSISLCCGPSVSICQSIIQILAQTLIDSLSRVMELLDMYESWRKIFQCEFVFTYIKVGMKVSVISLINDYTATNIDSQG